MTFRNNVKRKNGRASTGTPSKEDDLNLYTPPPTKSLFVAGPSKAQYATFARKSVRAVRPPYAEERLNSRQAKILANITHSAANAENPYQSIRRELNRTTLLPLDREVLGRQLAFLYGEGSLEVPPLPEPLPPAEAPDLYTHPLDYENRAAHVAARRSIPPIPVLHPTAPRHERQERQRQEEFRQIRERQELRQEQRMRMLEQQRTQMLAQKTESTKPRKTRTTRTRRNTRRD